jgi:hypothetical protein
MISKILFDDPGGLLISEIMKQTIEVRKMWFKQRDHAKKMLESYGMPTKELLDPKDDERKLPGDSGITRKTIRNHLKDMMKLRQVAKFSDRYVLLRPPLPLRTSTRLTDSVTLAVDGKLMHQRHYLMAPDVAGYFIVGDIDLSKGGFGDFFASHSREFEKDMFWLDKILAYGVTHKYFPEGLYSQTTDSFDIKLLRKGWKRCFEDSKLLLFVFAISPAELLDFLTTPVGRAMAARYLKERWGQILTEARNKSKLLKEFNSGHSY